MSLGREGCGKLKFRRCCWDVAAFNMSNENLDNLNGLSLCRRQMPRPISLSNFHQRARVPQTAYVIKQAQPRGFIFVWPQRRNFLYEREYAAVVRVLAQLLYWMDMFKLFPSGTGLPTKRPPWNVIPPLPKPENREYIIEPDWNSMY